MAQPQLDGSVVTAEQTSTVSVTVGSNSNRMLIVAIGTHQAANASGITYNGVAMTLIKRQEGSFGEHAEIWGLVAPDTGTHNVVVSGANNYWAMGIYSLYDCDQNLPTIFGGASSGGSSNSVGVTTVEDDSWVIDVIGAEPVPTSSTSGATTDWSQQGASYQNAKGAHVNKAIAGSQTMSYSLSYGARSNMVAVVVEPVVAAASYKPQMMAFN